MEAESQRLRDARAEAAAHQRRGNFAEAYQARLRSMPRLGAMLVSPEGY